MYTKILSILQRLLPTGLALLLLGAIAPVQANTICVDSSPGLLAALVIGVGQSTPYTIKVVQGTYSLPGGYKSLSAPTTIEGGYTSATCVTRVVAAANTVIDFGGAANNVTFSQLAGSPTALIRFDGLTLRNGGSLQLYSGEYHQYGSDDPGAIRMTHVRLTNFSHSDDFVFYPVDLRSHGADVTLEDVLIDHLSQTGANTPCSVGVGLDQDSLASLRYATIDLSNFKQLCFIVGGSSGNYAAEIYNSIVWSSDGTGTAISALDNHGDSDSFTLKFVNSTYYNLITGIATVSTSGSLFTNPQWALPSNGNYHLNLNSPALNTGTVIVPQGSPATDIEGNPRIVGTAPDRGAFESPFNDLQVFTVTSTLDTDANDVTQLRGAITAANSLANPATINFKIPTSAGSPCPHVIGLNSLLPPITSPIKIDGYAQQAGAIPNNDNDAFNATLCVVIKPASGTLGTGLRVSSGSASASLSLRGVGMGGFGQSVLLLDGKDHLIAGNQFGGAVGGVSLPGAGLNAISIGVYAGGSLIVGGTSTADRNVIVGANNGVNINSTVVSTPDKCQVVNNLIGLAPNGTSVIANNFGINMAGSGCLILNNRVAGNAIDGILINGSDNNVVQGNQVGIDALGNDAENGSGIRINGGSNNAIGTTASGSVFGTLLGNNIRYLGDAGVLVSSGTGNVVRSNRIVNTNIFAPYSVDIDLGSVGANPDDTNDPDGGANQLQNFPLVRGLSFASAPAPGATFVATTIAARLNSQPGTFRIDAYFSNGCNSDGRGGAEVYLGGTTATIAVGSNNVSFNQALTLPNAQIDAAVSLTATDAAGNTSEIGTCFPIERIFRSGMEIN
jgi:parallel beta-helix repeat protein